MDISIGDWTYTIIKIGTRTRIGVSVKVEFFRYNEITHILERLEEDSVSKTKERISEYFGCYDDIINTSFSIQNDNACFIDSSNIKRKDELERIMRFDIIKKLYELANATFSKDKAVVEHIKKGIKPDEIVSIRKLQLKSSKKLLQIINDRQYGKTRIEEIHNSILHETMKLNKEAI
jgi:DNA repair exonuclease SbcCD ATPase subunit